MIITEQKPYSEIKQNLKAGEKIFIIGCGECATTCKTGGESEVLEMKEKLEKDGFVITGYAVPDAPCVVSQVKITSAKYRSKIRESDSLLVLACGLGVQSVVENANFSGPVHVGCNTLFNGVVGSGAKQFSEYCSACGDCILEYTAGICPLTRCPKGILNGPCGGMDKGKCEVDSEKDCVWVLIYDKLSAAGRLDLLEKIYPPRDFSKHRQPAQRILK